MLKSLSQLINVNRSNANKKLDISVPNTISHFNWFARYNNSTDQNSQANATANITTQSFHSNV